MKKRLTITVFLLFLIPLASALDCSKTSDEDYCNTVKNSDLNQSEKDQIFSSLLYSDSEFPNHNFIEGYNLDITVDSPPDNTTVYNSRQIRNAWMSFLAVFPSIIEEGILYVSPKTSALSEFDYDVYVPPNYISSGYPRTSQGDCKRTYSLVQNDATLKYYLNNFYRGSEKLAVVNTNSDGELKSELKINTKLKIKHYHWYSYCCSWYKGSCRKRCHKCKYDYTNYEPDSMTISEKKDIQVYTTRPSADVTITNQYYNTTRGTFWAENYSFFRLGFDESYLTKQGYYYDLVFDKKPYYFAYLEAHNFSRVEQKNLYLANDTFFVKNAQNCSLFAYNHFYNFSSECDMTLQQEEVEGLEKEENDVNLSLLFYTLLFLLVIYIIYRIAKSQFKKIVIPIIFILLLVSSPIVMAAEPEEEECGITNLASCIPAKLYDYFLYIINAPLLPMLAAIKHLITAEVSIDMFYHLWSVIRYILGFFYIFFFLYAGYMFLTANNNPIKRAHAKELLKNTVLMIVMINGSFYIYGLILNISSIMDNAMLGMIDPHFFLITADNITNIGMEFLFVLAYASTLFWTMLMLALRYIIVSFGVVLFPIGLFCYFIPPLKGYGRFLINMLAIFIFVAFIDLLIILACSMLVEAPVFANLKILVMIICFSIVNYTIWLAIKFALKRSTNTSLRDDINQAVKYITLLA